MKVGLMVPLGKQEDLGRTLSYPEIRDLALRAEAAGLDSVWIYDHLIFHFPEKDPAGVWEGWTIWSALAEATKRVELGALVLCVPFRNPAVLAKMAVTLDEVSGGRIILGLGAGWHQPEFDAFGIPFDHLVDRFEEALKIIVPLVRSGAVDVTGRHYAAPSCELLPRPARPIPVLIASFKPRMLRLTAEYADSWNTAWLGQIDALAEPRAALAAACADVGRDPATLEVTAGLNVAFPDLGTVPETADDPAKFLAGSGDDVAAGLRAYAAAGVGHVICTLYPLSADAVDRLAAAAANAKR